MVFCPRFAVIFELILLYFLFNKLVICFICRILAFRSVTPAYPLQIRSHLDVSGPHAFALNIRARQRDFPWSYRQSRQRRPAPNRRIRQGSHHSLRWRPLRANGPRTSNGRVFVDVWASGFVQLMDYGPVLRHQQLPRPDRSVTSMHLSGGRVR